MTQLDRRRFEALAGYTRHPAITLLTRELDWFSDPNERLLGTLVWDRVDDDYGWAVFGRDAADRFRASRPTLLALRPAKPMTRSCKPWH